MSNGFDELHKLALDLSAAPMEAVPNIVKAVAVSAGKGKKAWQAAAKKHRYSGSYPVSIDYDTVKVDKNGTIATDLGPNLDRGGTAGLGIVEDSPDGVNGAPQRNYLAAEKVIEEDLPNGIDIAIDQTMRGRNL